MCCRVLPYSGIQLMTFDQFKKLALARRGPETKRLSPMEKFTCGALAGATSVAMTYPLDLMRARMAVQRVHHKYANLSHAFKTMRAEEGVRSMYRGIAPTMLGILPYAGLSFFTFETAKHRVADWRGRDPTTFEKLGCGAVAGLVGQSATYPLDICRRRMQTAGFMDHHPLVGPGVSHSGGGGHAPAGGAGHPVATMRSIVRTVLDTEGPRGLFKV